MSDVLEILYGNKSFKDSFEGTIGTKSVSGDIKIDTGCATTAIMVRDLAPDDVTLKLWKHNAIRSYKRSGHPSIHHTVGVHDGHIPRKPIKKMSVEELLKCKTIAFHYKMSNFIVAGFNFGTVDVLVSYDAVGESLLGMNILKDYDSSISLNKNKDVVFKLKNRKDYSSGILKDIINSFKSGKSVDEVISSFTMKNGVDDSVIWDCVKDIISDQHITENSWGSIEERLRVEGKLDE